MPSAKKNPVTIQTTREYQRELQFLYARKSAIDSLIASLEEYDRYRALQQRDLPRHTRLSA